MTNLPDFGALQRAVEMYSSPHVVEVLACLDDDRQPSESIPYADADLVDAAVRRLMDLGVVRPADPPSDTSAASQHLTLTAKGQRIARLVHELRTARLDDDDAEDRMRYMPSR